MKNKQTNQSLSLSAMENSFSVHFQPRESGTYFINVTGVIESVDQFAEAIHVLRMVSDDDQIVINLSTPGGCVSATDAFLHAMKGCQAHIHGVATGSVSSAGTAILLQCGSFELSDGFDSLIHCGSILNAGTSAEFFSAADFNKKHFSAFFRRTYEHFLEPIEIENVIKGIDMHLDAEEWVARHLKRNEILAALAEEEQDEEYDTIGV